MLARLYLAVQILRDAAGFSGLIARVIARFNNVRLDSTFAFRSILRGNPLGVVVAFFGLTMVVEGYALHVFERPVCATDFALKASWCNDAAMGLKDFSDLSVSIWNAVITSLTIGYGDVVSRQPSAAPAAIQAGLTKYSFPAQYPVTHPGRIVSVISGTVGAVTTALLINSVAEFVRLPPDSERVQRAIRLAELERKRCLAATRVVRAFMAHCAFRRRPAHRAAMAAAAAGAGAGTGAGGASNSGVANRLIRAVAGGAYSGRVPSTVTRDLTASVIEWRLFLAHYWRRTHNRSTDELIYREVLLLSEKVALLAAQASAERRFAEERRRGARRHRSAAGSQAASFVSNVDKIVDSDSEGGGKDGEFEGVSGGSAGGSGGGGGAGSYGPSAAECDAAEKRQLRLLEQQREIAEPKAAGYRASRAKQERSRARRAEAFRAAVAEARGEVAAGAAAGSSAAAEPQDDAAEPHAGAAAAVGVVTVSN